MQSTSSPGAYLGLSEVGAGTGVGTRGVIIFSITLMEALGAQAVTRRTASVKCKKHRAILFPLCFPENDVFKSAGNLWFIQDYSSSSRRITASDWAYRSAVITLSPLTSFPS